MLIAGIGDHRLAGLALSATSTRDAAPVIAHTGIAQHVGDRGGRRARRRAVRRGVACGCRTRRDVAAVGVDRRRVALVAWRRCRMETLAQESFTGHMVQHLRDHRLAAPLLVLAGRAHRRRMLRARGDAVRRASRSRAMGRRGTAGRRSVAPGLFLVVLFVDASRPTSTTRRSATVRARGRACRLPAGGGARCGRSCSVGGSATRGVDRVACGVRGDRRHGIARGDPDRGDGAADRQYATPLGAADALDDQRAAAAIMWVTGMAITVPLLVRRRVAVGATEQRIAERARSNSKPLGPTPPTTLKPRPGAYPSGMRRAPSVVAVLVAGAVLATAACSGSDNPSSAGSPPQATVTAAPATPPRPHRPRRRPPTPATATPTTATPATATPSTAPATTVWRAYDFSAVSPIVQSFVDGARPERCRPDPGGPRRRRGARGLLGRVHPRPDLAGGLVEQDDHGRRAAPPRRRRGSSTWMPPWPTPSTGGSGNPTITPAANSCREQFGSRRNAARRSGSISYNPF